MLQHTLLHQSNITKYILQFTNFEIFKIYFKQQVFFPTQKSNFIFNFKICNIVKILTILIPQIENLCTYDNAIYHHKIYFLK